MEVQGTCASRRFDCESEIPKSKDAALVSDLLMNLGLHRKSVALKKFWQGMPSDPFLWSSSERWKDLSVEDYRAFPGMLLHDSDSPIIPYADA